jgi:hypothetical protein
MRILNLQNTILVSLLVAGAAASAACGSSNAPNRPTGTAGTSSTTGGTGNTTGGTTGTTGGTVSTTGGTVSTTGGTTGIAGSVSTGGTGGTGVAPGPSVCDGTGSRVLMNTPADAFIDDFEKVQMAGATAASPAWYGFNDITPPNSVQILRTPGGAASTGFGGEYKGMGAKTPVMMGYGVGVEVNVGVDPSIMQFCVDASAFQGVSFWAKAATSTNAMISAGFVVPSQNKKMFNGDCADTGAVCDNYPQKNLVLTTDWAQYTVDFAGLKGATGATVVGNKIQQVLWLAPTSDWDFSLDEVAFYMGTPPAGAVAVPAGGGGTGGSN